MWGLSDEIGVRLSKLLGRADASARVLGVAGGERHGTQRFDPCVVTKLCRQVRQHTMRRTAARCDGPPRARRDERRDRVLRAMSIGLTSEDSKFEMELRAKCNNQIEIQQNFKRHSDMGKRGRGARRRRSGTQESASSESGTAERASVSLESNHLVYGPPTEARAAEQLSIAEKSLRLVSRIFEKQEEHAVVVGTQCGVEITRKMFGLDGSGKGSGPKWELMRQRGIYWDLYLLTDYRHPKMKGHYWKACLHYSQKLAKEFKGGTWDVVPIYVVDGVVPANHRSAEGVVDRKLGCYYSVPNLPEVDFCLPEGFHRTGVVVKGDGATNRELMSGVRQIPGARICMEVRFIDVSPEFKRMHWWRFEKDFRVTLVSEGQTILSWKEEESNLLILRVLRRELECMCPCKTSISRGVGAKLRTNVTMRWMRDGAVRECGRSKFQHPSGKESVADHVDRNSKNNSWANLRELDDRMNKWNSLRSGVLHNMH